MAKLVFISGDFSSGTTLLFTLFRKTPGCYCLYEPLHAKLPEYLVWPPRAYGGHFFVDQYYSEYKGFDRIPELFDPAWSASRLFLEADEPADDLYRYLSYLIGTAYGRARVVVVKENRFTFRLAWLRANFPGASIVNVYRECDDQWRSWVRRAQEQLAREDVGQDRVDFKGFRFADWCEDLKSTFPELEASASQTGYERFAKLWHLSREQHERYADACVGLRELVEDFEPTLDRISQAVGFRLDPDELGRFVVAQRAAATPRPAPQGVRRKVLEVIDRLGRRYAELRIARRRRSFPVDGRD
jgi:hypothetical protein